MIVDFGKYSYSDGLANTTYNPNEKNKYAFDEALYDDYIAKGDFESAYRYASDFTINNVNKDREFKNQLYMMRRDGRKRQALYQSVTDPQDVEQLDFIQALDNNNVYSMRTTNKYAKNYQGAFDSLGNNSSSISITFAPEKRTLFGIDWLAKDNSNNISNFYKITGLNEQTLREQGIIPTYEKDGSTTLTFSKSHPLANTLIIGLSNTTLDNPYKPREAGFGIPPSVISGLRSLASSKSFMNKGFTGTLIGGLLNMESGDTPTKIRGYNPETKEFIDLENSKFYNYDALTYIRDIVDSANNVKDKFATNQFSKTMRYDTTIGEAIDPILADLQGKLYRGEITESQLQTLYATRKDNILGMIKELSTNNYDFYTNGMSSDDMYDDNWQHSTDEDRPLRKVKSQYKEDILATLSAIPLKDLDARTMICNGQVGTVISVPVKDTDDEDLKESNQYLDKRHKTDRIQVFVPGLYHEEAQRQINNNSYLKACDEFNQMQTYGYVYETVDGNKLKANGDGTFQYADKPSIDAAHAKRILLTDISISDARTNLRYNFISNNGNFIDKTAYEDLVKRLSYSVGNEIYPNIPYMDVNGNPIDIDAAFKLKTLNDADTTQFDLKNKLNYVFYIYDTLMSDLNRYY